jgi:hypothetical protein
MPAVKPPGADELAVEGALGLNGATAYERERVAEGEGRKREHPRTVRKSRRLGRHQQPRALGTEWAMVSATDDDKCPHA